MTAEELLFTAINIGSPWRGLNVHPGSTTAEGELAAVMYLSALSAAAGGEGTSSFIGTIQFSQEIFNSSMGDS